MRASSRNADVHKEYCSKLSYQFHSTQEAWSNYAEKLFSSGQTVIAEDMHRKTPLAKLASLYAWNCETLHSDPNDNVSLTGAEDEPLRALLEFMIHATPSAGLADSITRSPETFLKDMSITLTPHLINEGAPVSGAFEVDGVPDATDKVRGRMAWMQVPKDSNSRETGLELVWKVCVPCDCHMLP